MSFHPSQQPARGGASTGAGSPGKPANHSASASISRAWLHDALVKALSHVDAAAPQYLTADVLTDELLPAIRSIQNAA